MAYPVGPLLRVLAQRILKNLELIDHHAPLQDGSPFSDTQLMMSMLGILVFPNAEALGELLGQYEGELDKVIRVKDHDGSHDLKSIKRLPRFLRNSIAHYNVRPINTGGRFSGLTIWNVYEGKINFVADLDFDAFRPLAEHILKSLEKDTLDVKLEDPPDPMVEVATY